jgi:hypothetical protein
VGLDVRYALTQFSGASCVPSRFTIYLGDRAEEVFAALAWRPAERGGNVAVWTPYHGSAFWGTRKVRGMTVASPLQLYLDLVAAGDEGLAAAETIFCTELEPAWRG